MKKLVSYFIALILLFSNAFAYTIDESADVLVRLNLMKGYEDGTSVIRLEVVDGSRISVRYSVVEEETDPSLVITVPNYEDVLITSDYAIQVFISKAN